MEKGVGVMRGTVGRAMHRDGTFSSASDALTDGDRASEFQLVLNTLISPSKATSRQIRLSSSVTSLGRMSSMSSFDDRSHASGRKQKRYDQLPMENDVVMGGDMPTNRKSGKLRNAKKGKPKGRKTAKPGSRENLTLALDKMWQHDASYAPSDPVKSGKKPQNLRRTPSVSSYPSYAARFGLNRERRLQRRSRSAPRGSPPKNTVAGLSRDLDSALKLSEVAHESRDSISPTESDASSAAAVKYGTMHAALDDYNFALVQDTFGAYPVAKERTRRRKRKPSRRSISVDNRDGRRVVGSEDTLSQEKVGVARYSSAEEDYDVLSRCGCSACSDPEFSQPHRSSSPWKVRKESGPLTQRQKLIRQLKEYPVHLNEVEMKQGFFGQQVEEHKVRMQQRAVPGFITPLTTARINSEREREGSTTQRQRADEPEEATRSPSPSQRQLDLPPEMMSMGENQNQGGWRTAQKVRLANIVEEAQQQKRDWLVAFGSNTYGQLGCTGKEDRAKPSMVKFRGKNLAQIAAGGEYACALTVEGLLYMWGRNSHGELGLGDVRDRHLPWLVRGVFQKIRLKKVACGYEHTLALSVSGAVYAWGCNESGQLGNGKKTSPAAVSMGIESEVLEPQRVQGFKGRRCSDIACGENHNLVIDEKATLWSWGNNAQGALGLGHFESVLEPTQIPQTYRRFFVSISCAADASIACTDHGDVFTWGDDELGQLGHGNVFCKQVGGKSAEMKKSVVLQGVRIVEVAAGFAHMVVVSDMGRVYSWGYNAMAQLGTVTSSDIQRTPILIGTLKEHNIIKASCGLCHSVFLSSKGDVLTCGKGDNGRLGHRDQRDKKNATRIIDLVGKNAFDISAGGEFTVCALRTVS